MPRLSFSGFDRGTEAKARALFEGLRLPDWAVSDEAGADAVLIDLDSIYGQMAWLKGLDGGKVSIGVTGALRADTAYRLPSDFGAEALAEVLHDVALGLAAAKGQGLPRAPEKTTAPTAAIPPPASAEPAVPTPTDTPAPPAVAPSATSTREVPVASRASTESRLAARIARATGAFTVELPGLPRLVIDPASQQFAPGKSLKALLGYATADLPVEAITPIAADAVALALKQAGDPQPLARLSWLLALGGGEGKVQGHGPATRFQLGKWPQAEREFPKHFRIATVMLKAPGSVAEIVAASGATEAEVADYINAALAAGHATTA